MSLCADREGNEWVGTEDTGVYRCDVSGRWTQFTTKDGLGDDNGYSLACDLSGRVWVGHLNHGVSVFDGTRWQNYEVAAGLSRIDSRAGPLGERVFKIAVNPRSGDVWIATNVGLARYASSADRWSYYTRLDGLPSNAIAAVAVGADGTVYAGTATDGIAVARASDSYHAWRSTAGPEHEGIVASGVGLPSGLINDLLVADDGVVWAATNSGLAMSRNKGVTWAFVRGADYADKAKLAPGGPPRGWKPVQEADTLLEDYCTTLAEDGAKKIWVGHRQVPYEVLDARTGHRVRQGSVRVPDSQTKSMREADQFVTTILPLSDDETWLGKYGEGVVVPTPASGLSGERPADMGTPPAAAAVQPLNLPASTSTTASDVDALASRARKSAPGRLAKGDAECLGEDWTTAGDWVGRYGRQYAILCSADSPLDHYLTLDKRIKVAGDLGPYATKGDGLRHWCHWDTTADPRVLWDACVGHRRQAEWDDHGEVYPMAQDGPDIWIAVDVPAGLQQIDLYFFNKDGHEGANRWRDYLLNVRRWTADYAAAQRAKPLATARVRQFWGGVHERFAVSGPAKYLVQVARNHSLNTICSAVFVDRISGPPGPNDDMPLAGLGNLPYNPLNVDIKGSSPPPAVGPLSAASPAFQAVGIEAYRAAPAGPQAAAWRWALKLWMPDDRVGFDNTMQQAWAATLAQNPQLADKR